MPHPLLSVVVVTYNDIPGLRATLKSLESLARVAGSEVEVLVVDGGSPPNMIVDVATDFPFAMIHSEPDDGIYDAMNKGLSRSTGEWIWFLNGGDTSAISDLQPVPTPANAIVFFAYELAGQERTIRRRSRGVRDIWHALPTSHQAILFPGEPTRSMRYDTTYPVAADYALVASLIKSGVSSWRSRTVLARFSIGGFSSVAKAQLRSDARRVQQDILSAPTPLIWVSGLRHVLAARARGFLS